MLPDARRGGTVALRLSPSIPIGRYNICFLMLYLNGVCLGILKPEREDSFGWRGDEPESPGASVIPAYAVGRLHDKLKVGVSVTDYKTVVQALRNLFDVDPSGVYYLSESDDYAALYGNETGVWLTNIYIQAKCTLWNMGELTLEGTVTTDCQDSPFNVYVGISWNKLADTITRISNP